MRRRTFIRAGGAAGVGIALAGCTGNGNGNGNGNGAGNGNGNGADDGDLEMPDTIRIGTPSPDAPTWEMSSHPGLQYALEDRGHDTELTREQFTGFTGMAAAFVSDEADMGYMGLSSLINAIEEGFPLVGFAGYINEYVFPVVVAPEIEEWEDLRDGDVAIHDPDSISTPSAQIAIREELGSIDDVNYRSILGTTNRLSALEAGEVQGAAVFDSGAYQAEAEGYGRVLSHPTEYEQLNQQTVGLWVTLEENLDENEEVYGEIADCLAQGHGELYERDEDEVLDDALDSGIYPDFDRDAHQQSFEIVKEAQLWPDGIDITEEELERSLDVLEATGLVSEDRRLSRDEVFDDRFV
ncbi:ABC transporter substrate-binding protein [Natrarchaeobius oligotrophus]|uniref:ABC transporter substrate-binding protein n=1 Tax=Natrarchaeobius chitinivorans TaxID=1679083 RepID=A0A3N6MEI3_NATCH|nr:ABC transporter substrate-binding protein [Natrarchaeobius chitinivorans]RQH02309.1 ABC transporter substrate-binding protein [Natrarchaeobius chitinivorans]